MSNIREFFNEVANDNRIFTREDIGQMTGEEFRSHEKAIDYQLSNIGIPRNMDMSTSDDVVYVHAYKRADGTEVRAHYRSKSGGVLTQTNIFNNNKVNTYGTEQLNMNYSNHLTGLAANIDFKDIENILIWKGFNNVGNSKYYDSWDLMNKALTGTGNLQKSNDYVVIDAKLNDKISKHLNISIPTNMNGIIFSSNSSLAQNIMNSPEFLKEIESQKFNGFNKTKFLVSFNKDPNLFRSLHNVTVVNPKVDKNGNFSAYVYDVYDFKYDNKLKGINYFANTGATILQNKGNLENYYIIIPIKMKIPF